MDDDKQVSNKDSVRNSKNQNDKENVLTIIKRCHFLDGKYFVVIDESIIRKLGLSNHDIYFSEEVTNLGLLLLRPVTISD